LAVVAGNTLIAEPQAMIQAADAAGLFVTGIPA
jgi:UDP-2,3-diacylglucosamine hydrolase